MCSLESWGSGNFIASRTFFHVHVSRNFEFPCQGTVWAAVHLAGNSATLAALRGGAKPSQQLLRALPGKQVVITRSPFSEAHVKRDVNCPSACRIRRLLVST